MANINGRDARTVVGLRDWSVVLSYISVGSCTEDLLHGRESITGMELTVSDNDDREIVD
jgi:hypothetical protein